MIWIIFCVLLSIIPAVFWFWFLIISKKEVKILPFRLLIKLFLGGAFLAIIAMTIEGNLGRIFPWSYLSYAEEPLFVFEPKTLGFIFILTFLIIAPLEEILKFLFLKREIYKAKEIKQTIQGVQMGIILSLGFATFENIFYFHQAASYHLLGGLFILRFFLSTLAHVLYGGILGYYLSLSKFHKLYSGYFLRTGLLTVILLHGFFNFSLLTQVFYYTIGVIIIVFIVLIKWIIDRRDFETFIVKKRTPVSAPFLAKKQEIDTFLTKESFRFSEIKKLSFCPRCLAIKKMDEDTCSYCGMKFG